jgi:glycosyltransferase involved in cell wall biosynthesis
MNILSISTLFPTPDMPNHGIFVYNRLKAMAKISGNHITVLNPIPSSPAHKVLPRYAGQQSAPLEIIDPNFQGRIHHPRYLSIPGFFKDKEHQSLLKSKAWSLCLKLNQETKFDIIDVHWAYPDLPFAIRLAKHLGIKTTITLRGMETFYLTEPDKRKTLIAKAMGYVNGVISLSQEMLSTYEKTTLNMKPTPLRVVRNGVDTKTFTYLDKKFAREQLNIPTENILILGVGSLIRRKGFHHIIHALNTLKDNLNKPITYAILGSTGLEGDFESELKALIDTFNFNNSVHCNVKLVGKVPNATLPVWYNAADLFCLSSFGEGSPNVLTEAISCGCPAVASEVGSVLEIMNSEDNLGCTIQSTEHYDSVDAGLAWAAKIEEALEQPRDRKHQSKQMEKYTWDWCAAEANLFLKEVKYGN